MMKIRICEMKDFLKEIVYGLFVEPFILFHFMVKHKIFEFISTLRGSDCPYSPMSNLGTKYSLDKHKNEQEHE